MIIKEADDKQPQLAILQNLTLHPAATDATKKRIEQEIRNIRAGIRGESETAYEMKLAVGDSTNWMVIHDLRIEHAGLVAQIDHLIINRTLQMWVCESKNFSEGVAVNAHGEFSAFYGSKPYGIPSPIEQNNRHITVLKRIFHANRISMPTRMGFTITPEINSLVLVSKGARISRPKAKVPGLETIIKNDMLFNTIDKSFDDPAAVIFGLAKVVSSETLQQLAQDIADLHTPIEFNWQAKFGLGDLPEPPAYTPQPVSPPPVVSPQPQAPIQQPKPAVDQDSQKPKQKLICHTCSASVPYNVAKFCWTNKTRFNGNLYCMACQKNF